MERRSQPDSFELSDYVAVLRRRWWILSLAALLGLAGAVAYTMLTPATYTSSATVYVRALSTDNNPGANKATGGVDLDTEAQVIQSASVATLAKQMMNSSQSAASLLTRITVTVPANSQVLQIGCTGRKATAAAQCAHAFAAAYLQSRSAAAANLIQTQLSALQQREQALQQKITDLTLKIKALARGSSERITLNAELSTNDNQLTLLSSHAANLEAQSANLNAGRVLTDAAVPRHPSDPRPSLYLPSGLAAGLLIGLVVAFWRDRSDKRVRGARDVENTAYLPVLLDLSRGKGRPRLALADPRSRTGQAFAELGHSLVATLGQGNHVVLVAGAAPGHGGSLAAANLAAALARTGSEAILVCADLRGSISPALFGLTAGPGLAQVVLDRATIGEVERHPAEVPQLRVITPGVDGHLANYHLQRDVTERLVNRLRARARYVIFEAPPTADGADVYALAQLVDAAVMAIEVPRSLRGEVLAGVRQLDRMGAAVLGAVVLPSLDKAAPPRVVRESASAAARDAQRQASEEQATELQTPDRVAADPQATDLLADDSLATDSLAPDPQTTDHSAAPRVSKRVAADPWVTDSLASDPRTADQLAAPRVSKRLADDPWVTDPWVTDSPAPDSRATDHRITPPVSKRLAADQDGSEPVAPRSTYRQNEPHSAAEFNDGEPADYLVYPPRPSAVGDPAGTVTGSPAGTGANSAAYTDIGTGDAAGAMSGAPRSQGRPRVTDDGAQADEAPDASGS